jgi:hypothetical protein
MRHFFADEAGDLTLFDKRGRSMLGRDGVSQCFMVGVAEIRNPTVVGRRLDALRRDLMSVRISPARALCILSGARPL